MTEAEIRDRLVGSWRLLSCDREEMATGRRSAQFGPSPSGYITYAPSGHMMALITADGRAAASDAAGKAALHGSMLAYAGTWDVAGDAVRHRLEVSWQPATVGDTFVRHVAFEGNRLILRSDPGPSALDGVLARVTVTWERA